MKHPPIGGGHPLRPDQVTSVEVIRKHYLCVDEAGRRATVVRCKFCDCRCRWGERYLDLLGEAHGKQGRSLIGDMLKDDQRMTLKQTFARMRIGRTKGGND
jgi:hypothetical protein